MTGLFKGTFYSSPACQTVITHDEIIIKSLLTRSDLKFVKTDDLFIHDVNNWLRENCQNSSYCVWHYNFKDITNEYTIYWLFRDKNDAMHFSMKWSNV